MITIHEHVRQSGSIAESARQLGVDYLTLFRWLKRTHYASRSWRVVMLNRGVHLPLRPRINKTAHTKMGAAHKI